MKVFGQAFFKRLVGAARRMNFVHATERSGVSGQPVATGEILFKSVFLVLFLLRLYGQKKKNEQ